MSRLARIQLRFQTQEGGQITSTALVIGGQLIECITIESFQSLMGAPSGRAYEFAKSFELIITVRNGIHWVTVNSVFPMLVLTMQDNDA